MIHPPRGALNIAAEDMLRVVQLPLSRGAVRGPEFLPSAMIERMAMPRTWLAARAGLTYGDGLGLHPWCRNGVRSPGHDGDAGGRLVQFGYAPARGLGYFVALNRANRAGLGARCRAMQTAIIGAGLPELPRATLTPADQAALCGDWRALTARFPARRAHVAMLPVPVKDGRLECSTAGRA
jgi:hypothetical protein